MNNNYFSELKSKKNIETTEDQYCPCCNIWTNKYYIKSYHIQSQQHQANVIKFINYLVDIQLKKIIKPLDHDSNMEIINDHYADSIRLS